MSLVLEIEFLTGVCRASFGRGDSWPDWPPQPDRIFSALTSAWGDRGQNSREREALEWLEAQSAPEIFAGNFTARTSPVVFVPPNDQMSSTAIGTYLKILPEHRPRQPRRFPVATLDDAMVELVWPEEPSLSIVSALNSLASCVGYIGHSASLARCRFFHGNVSKSERRPTRPIRRVYSGRLSELEEAYQANPIRPVIRSGSPIFEEAVPSPELNKDWLVLEVLDGEVPDIRASALVCQLIRRTLMSGYGKINRADSIPEEVSGHNDDNTPSRNPHITVVPMAFVGSSPHATGSVLGFAVAPPRGIRLSEIKGFLSAFEAVAPYCERRQRRIMTLQGNPLRRSIGLGPSAIGNDHKSSLRSAPYLDKYVRWASVTPIVLDRHLKHRSEDEVEQIIAQSCEQVGLPRPTLDRIQVGKHSAMTGVPPARPLSGEPPWARWKLPRSVQTRQLIHAVIDFEQPVAGPVLLGAGRFAGLGLFRGVR